MTTSTEWVSPVYQGQFGEFTITDRDRQEVLIYRSGLVIAALSFGVATAIALWLPDLPHHWLWLSSLYTTFYLGLGVSLFTIHIYLKLLHRVLQGFWLIGGLASLAIAHLHPDPFVLTVYQQPITILGVGFTFAALTGIYFKEAFCFNRLETKVLTPLVPALLLGHLVGIWSGAIAQTLLLIWAGFFAIFAVRKCIQPIPPDIGDKSVFAYLKSGGKLS